MKRSTAIWPLAVALAVIGVTGLAMQGGPVSRVDQPPQPVIASDLSTTLEAVNGELHRLWTKQGLTPAVPADDLAVLRRLTLALFGTGPSLEEIRRFQADSQPQKIERWTAEFLNDVRFADYFAERLARALVGVEQGQFILFRRDRFKSWLSEQIHKRRPYDEIVRDMIASNGVWTDKAQVNFLSASYANDDFDENKLAGRTVRAFLGQRIDCAQCHDHPFTHWKQNEFEGLAACYGQTRVSLVGIDDNPELQYKVEDRKTLEERAVTPAVPFGPDWFPGEGSPRTRLAAWVTDPGNKRFERAIANRVWGLLFGKPYYTISNVDDLPDPDDATTADETRMLDLLGADFRAHDCDLHRLIQAITASQAFRVDSRFDGLSESDLARAECLWAVFPLVRMRPEQVVGSMLQASSIKTIDQNSHLFTRFLKYFRERDFVEDFGDPGENELGDRTGTIPQALLRMNGELSQELSKATPFNAASRIAGMTETPEKCVELCYLVCLCRLPTAEEREHFAKQIPAERGSARHEAVADLFWTLFNSPEFSWNH
jgi:hypothetical protein